MATVEKLKKVEFNNKVKVRLNIGGDGSQKWGDMTQAFKNISHTINEKTFTASYLCDEGFESTIVTGASPALALSGDYIKGDPVCEYLEDIQYEIGDGRISEIEMERGSITVTCPVTLTGVAIAGGESTAPNTVNVNIAFNGKPTVTKGTMSESTTE